MNMTVLKVTNDWMDIDRLSPEERLSKIKETLQDLNVPARFNVAIKMKGYLLKAREYEEAHWLKSYLMKSEGIKKTKAGYEYMLRRLLSHKNVTIRRMIVENDGVVPTSENPATKDEVIEALNAIEVFDICIAVILWDWDRYFEGR